MLASVSLSDRTRATHMAASPHRSNKRESALKVPNFYHDCGPLAKVVLPWRLELCVYPGHSLTAVQALGCIFRTSRRMWTAAGTLKQLSGARHVRLRSLRPGVRWHA